MEKQHFENEWENRGDEFIGLITVKDYGYVWANKYEFEENNRVALLNKHNERVGSFFLSSIVEVS